MQNKYCIVVSVNRLIVSNWDARGREIFLKEKWYLKIIFLNHKNAVLRYSFPVAFEGIYIFNLFDVVKIEIKGYLKVKRKIE